MTLTKGLADSVRRGSILRIPRGGARGGLVLGAVGGLNPTGCLRVG